MLDKTKTETTEVIYGSDKIIKFALEGMSRLKSTHNVCLDYRGISVIVTVEPVKEAYIDLDKRGVKVRIITEITRENIPYCNEVMKFADLRHLDGIKGNFSVSDGREYTAVATVEEAKPLEQLIYSNVKAVAKQQQYFFETLWNKATPAKRRFREIEEGFVEYRTRIIEDPDEILKEMRRKNLNSKMLSVCGTSNGMQMSYRYFWDTYLRIIEKQRREDKNDSEAGVRWVAYIDKDNMELARKFLEIGIRFRHINNLPPLSFGLNEKELHATIDKIEGGKQIQSVLASNELAYVEHFHAIFEELWKNAIDANERIRQLEQGIEPANIEVITNFEESVKRGAALVLSAKEVQVFFATAPTFERGLNMGILDLYKQAIKQNQAKIQLLIPQSENTEKMIANLKAEVPEVNARISTLQTNISIMTVDKKELMIWEERSNENVSEPAVGLITYSNSKSIVSSFVAIFESLWTQTELYEEIRQSNQQLAEAYSQLEVHDRLQKEFINIAAHELRTPIQPILGMSELIESASEKISDNKIAITIDELAMIIRNAKRLERLASDILEVARIESQGIALNLEGFNIDDIISSAIKDIRTQIRESGKANLKTIYKSGDIWVRADKGKLNEVLANLLGNAVKFTSEGSITIQTEISSSNDTVTVSIKDTGTGIDPEIMPRLFSKFVTNSSKGTGLGLFISKKIVEAHGGAIDGRNNDEGIGATFTFSIPIRDNLLR